MISVALKDRIGADFEISIDLEIPSEGVTALLGPSGSGKTTLLRAIAGLDRVAGTIVVNGVVWQDPKSFFPPHHRRIGFVFQGMGLLPHLSVGENLAYAAKRAGDGPFVFENIVARTGIAALLDRSPARLSGGEAQRASIARALLSQPRLLLMDEPLSALDTEARAGMLAALEQLFAAISIPVLYVTHDAAEAARLASRTVRLRNGYVESAG